MSDQSGIAGSQAGLWPRRRAGTPAADPVDEKDHLLQLIQRSLGAGVPLGEDVRRRAESWFGRDLGDVRVHDSEQATSLARRLGAEAFTIKSHVLGPSGKLSVETAEGRGLLAHEITHVVQQTASDEVPAHPSRGAEPVVGQTPGGYAGSLLRTSGDRPWPLPVGREAINRVSLQVSQDIVQRQTEREAQVNEVLAGNTTVQRETAKDEGPGPAPAFDVSEIADRVYNLMVQDLTLERERGAMPA